MSILATIEVDDQGTVKLEAFRNALNSLAGTAAGVEKQVQSSGEQTSRQSDALSALTRETKMAHEETLRQAESYGLLTNQLKAGTTVTATQAAAIKQLGDAVVFNNKYTDAFAGSAAKMNRLFKEGAVVTPEMAAHLKQVGAEFANVNGLVQQTGRALETGKQGLEGFSAAAAATAAAFGLMAAGVYSLLKTSGDLAARIEVLDTVMAVTAKNSKYANSEMMIQIEKTKRLGITSKEAADSVLQFATANLKMADVSKIARAAQDLAVVAGMNSSQAFKTLTAAIQVQHPILLRQFGIVTGLTQIYGEYAAQIGKTTRELSDYEKREAFITKILKSAKDVSGAYEAAMGDVGKLQTSLYRFKEEAMQALGESLLPVMMKLTQATIDLLEWWTKLPEPVQRATTALLAAAAAATALTAALAGAKFLGILQIFSTLATRATFAFSAIKMGAATAGEALVFILGGGWATAILAVVAALGLLVGAIVYFTAATKDNSEALLKNAAAAQADISKINDLWAAVETYTHKTHLSVAELKDYNQKVKELEQAVPGVIGGIDLETGRWIILTEKIKLATQARREDLKTALQASEANLTKLEADIAQKVWDLAALRRQAAEPTIQVEEQVAGLEPGQITFITREYKAGTIEYARAHDELMAKIRAAEKDLAGVQAQASQMRQVLKEYNEPWVAMLEKGAQIRSKAVDEIRATVADLLKIDFSGMSKEAEQAANARIDTYLKTSAKLGPLWKKLLSVEEIRKAATVDPKTGDIILDGMFPVDPSEIDSRRMALVSALEETRKEMEAEKKKYENAYKAMIANLGEDLPAMEGRFDAIEKFFKGLVPGTVEYAQKLDVVAADLAKFGKMSEETQRKHAGLAPLLRDLIGIKVGETLRSWGLAADEALEKMARDFESMAEKMSTEKLTGLEAYATKMWDTEKSVNDGIYKLDRDLYEKTVLLKMNEVDQKIFANNKYYEDTIRTNELQIQAIEKMMAEEVRRVDEVKRNLDYEMDLKRRMAVQELREYREKELAKREFDLTLHPSAQAEATLEKARELAKAQNIIDEQRFDALRKEWEAYTSDVADNWREQVETQNESGRQMVANLKAQNERLREANIVTNREILKDYDTTYRHIRTLAQGVVDAVVNGFTAIMVKATSFKEAFIGIWQAIKASLLSIFTEITTSWIKMLTMPKQVNTMSAFQVAGQGMSQMGGTAGLSGTALMGLQMFGNAIFRGGAPGGAGAGGGGAAGSVFGAGAGAENLTFYQQAINTVAERAADKIAVSSTQASASVFNRAISSPLDSLKIFSSNLKDLWTKGNVARGPGGVITGKPGWWSGAGFGQTGGMIGAVPGGMVGGAVGSMVGSYVGGKTGSYAKGALSGAASGAATGFAMGGPYGALIGGAIGAISGLWSAHKAREEAKRMREDFIKAAGGLDILKERAHAAKISLDTMFDTKNPKDMEKVLKKIDNQIRAYEALKGFEDLYGGAEALRAKLIETGVGTASLDMINEGLRTATITAEQAAVAIQKMKDALDLAKMKKDLGGTASGLWDLKRAAEIVGFDIQKLYDAKTVEEFNGQQGILNDLLEKQAKRVNAIQQAVAGLQQRLAGELATYQKLLDPILRGLSASQKSQISGAYQMAQERGYKGSELSFILANMDRLPGATAAVQAQIGKTQEAFNRMGVEAATLFAALVRETGDWMAAMDAIGPTLDEMIAVQGALGLTADETFTKLLQFRQVITDNADIAASFSGITQMIRGMGDAGVLTGEMLNSLGADVVGLYQTLIDRGVDASQALVMAQPSLQQLWQAQKDYGLVLDENTQKLVDQAVEQGLVGAKFQDTNQKILDVLIAIGSKLGALPEYLANVSDELIGVRDGVQNIGGEEVLDDVNAALDVSKQKWLDWRDTAVRACEDTKEGTDSVAYGDSPGGVKGIIDQLAIATASMATFATVSGEKLSGVTRAIDTIPDVKVGVDTAEVTEGAAKVEAVAEQAKAVVATLANLPPVEPRVGLRDAALLQGVEQVKAALGTLEGAKTTPAVGLDAGAVVAGIEVVKTALESAQGVKAVASVDLNADAVAAGVEAVKAALLGIRALPPAQLQVGVDTSAVGTDVAQVEEAYDVLRDLPPTVPVTAQVELNKSQIMEGVEQIKVALAALQNMPTTDVVVGADTQQVADGVDNIQSMIDALTIKLNESVTQWMTWQDAAVAACANVTEAVDVVAVGASPGGVAGVTTQVNIARGAWDDWAAAAVDNSAEMAAAADRLKAVLANLAEYENTVIEQGLTGTTLKRHQLEWARTKELQSWLEQSEGQAADIIQRGVDAINKIYDYQLAHMGTASASASAAATQVNMNTIETLRKVWGLNLQQLPTGGWVPTLSPLAGEVRTATGRQATAQTEVHIHVTNQSHIETNVDAMAAGDVHEAFRTVIAPAMVDHLQTNTDQLARKIAVATRPYVPRP